MSAEEETTQSSEQQASMGANAAGSASAAGGLNASASKKDQASQKRKPPKLGSKNSTPSKELPQANGEPAGDEGGAGGEANGDADASEAAPETPQKTPKSRRQSRGRGRSRGPDVSDPEGARSEVSASGGGGKRNRNRKKGQQVKEKDGGGGGGGGPGGLGAVDEVGETVGGATDMVQNTAGGATDAVGGVADQAQDAVGGVTDKAGEAVGGLLGKKGGGEGEKDKDEGENEQLRLRLDLNLDVEIQLKAKIHGDLTIGLLYVQPSRLQSTSTNFDAGTETEDSSTSTRYYCTCLVGSRILPLAQCLYFGPSYELPELLNQYGVACSLWILADSASLLAFTSSVQFNAIRIHYSLPCFVYYSLCLPEISDVSLRVFMTCFPPLQFHHFATLEGSLREAFFQTPKELHQGHAVNTHMKAEAPIFSMTTDVLHRNQDR